MRIKKPLSSPQLAFLRISQSDCVEKNSIAKKTLFEAKLTPPNMYLI